MAHMAGGNFVRVGIPPYTALPGVQGKKWWCKKRKHYTFSWEQNRGLRFSVQGEDEIPLDSAYTIPGLPPPAIDLNPKPRS